MRTWHPLFLGLVAACGGAVVDPTDTVAGVGGSTGAGGTLQPSVDGALTDVSQDGFGGGSVDAAGDPVDAARVDAARDASGADADVNVVEAGTTICRSFPDIGCFSGQVCVSTLVPAVCDRGVWVCPPGSVGTERCDLHADAGYD